MTELLIGLRLDHSEHDLAIEFDDHTTIGQLADRIEQMYDRPGDANRTIERLTRSNHWFRRDDRISGCDLRSGDLIALSLDDGLRATSPTPPVASVRVSGGNDAGRVFELKRGDSTVGRSAHCDITLDDDMASRRHAIIRVTDIVEIADAGSTNGVAVDGERIRTTTRLRPGSRVELGDTVLTVDLVAGPSAMVEATDNRVEFNRPPRLVTSRPATEIELVPPPERPRQARLPMLTTAVPFLVGAVMLAVFRNPIYVAFMALSPMMVVGSYLESKRTGRHDHRHRLAEWEQVSAEQFDKLDEARASEVERRMSTSPSCTELLADVNDLSPRLWERQPGDDDFLHLRLGLRPQPSSTTVTLGDGGSRDDRAELAARAGQYTELPSVPVVVDGMGHAPIGLSGATGDARALARSLVVQAATLHSPDELLIGVIVSQHEADQWEWLKWLPHTRSTRNPVGRHPIAVGPDDTLDLLAQLNDLITQRSQRTERTQRTEVDEPDRTVFNPHLLVVVADSVPLERARFARLLDQGHRAGISVVWCADDDRRLPKACRSVIDLEPGGQQAALSLISEGTRLDGIPVESLPLEPAEVAARALAPIVDASTGPDESASIPRTVSTIGLLGGPEILGGPEVVLERWAQSAWDGGLRAPLGATETGILNIDLRADGPHGLIGGTTGSGKSELLQSLLAGLAASHSPERLNFLLIDYKGGSAFNDCVRMPHTVGLITDLTPTLVQRALISLRAERKRRERIINEYGAKDLMALEQQRPAEAPPVLLIVIDEFASLAADVPEFVDGVVDIARLGRGLGMHLLLATQRPAGVVTPNIEANTNLRIALRMAREEESNDVVDSPAAAYIDRSNPGRAVARRGGDDLVLFQSGYAGGVTTAEATARLDVGELTLNGITWQANPSGGGRLAATTLDVPDTPSDLKRLVRVLRQATRTKGIGPPRRPWLEPLPSTVDLLDLPRPESDDAIPFALLDDPDNQTRSVATFRPDQIGSMLVYGTGGAGKTVCLRSLAAAFGLAKDRAPVEVHALDFAGRGLAMLGPLPHVGTVIRGSEHELVTRLFKVLHRTIADRSEQFAAASASSLPEYRWAANPGTPRIVVLLDGFDNFTSLYERANHGQWFELLPRLVADGRQVGVHFVITGTRRSSFPMPLASSVPARLVMRMASADDFHSLGVHPKWFDDTSPPGRARFADHDIQVAVLGGSPVTGDESTATQRLATALTKADARQAEPIRALPALVTLADLPTRPAYGAVAWLLTEDFDAIGPSFDRNLLVAGPTGSGRTTAIASLLTQCQSAGLPVLAALRIGQSYGALTGTTPAELAKLIDQLQANQGLIFIDDADNLIDSPADLPLQRWIKTAPPGTTFIMTMRSATARKAYTPLVATLRERTETLVLNPDPVADATLLGHPLPASGLPDHPGRAYTNLRHPLEPVQTAT